MPDKAVLDAHIEEQEALLHVSRLMAEFVGSEGWPSFPTLDASLASDNKLQELTKKVRVRYLEGVSKWTSRRWRTPPDGIPMEFPGHHEPYSYTYDRQHPPKALESRFAADSATGVFLCSSGMAALNVVFQGLNFLIDHRLSIAIFASYFETLSLIRIGPFSRRFCRARSESEFSETIKDEKVGIILVEPIHYDWKLTVSQWPEILDALSERRYPPVVILDTTLSGHTPAQVKLLNRLRSLVPILICVRSGIKLDQQGLELANLGIVEFWCDDPGVFDKIGSTFRTCRSICGATLTWPDACALAPEGIFGLESFKAYSERILKTSRSLHDRLEHLGDLFASVSHPGPPWGAPLVILELAEGGAENYRELATLLDEQQERRELHWQMSGSFGFRSHRFETILPEELLRSGEAHAGALKIAPGCYAGARHEAIVELILELSSFPDLHAAGRALGRRHFIFGAGNDA